MDSMRKGSWRIVFVLVAALVALAASPAWAAGPTGFRADAVMTPGPGSAGWSIDAGAVTAAGKSGRFVVKDRTVTGVFFGGDINGPFSFTFGTNVPITTQSGQFHGTLTVTGTDGVTYDAQARGSSTLTAGPVLAFSPGAAIPGLPPNVVVAVVLDLNGGFTFTAGAQGNGAVDGTFTVAIHPATGHILFLVPSGFPLLNFTVNPDGTVNVIGFAGFADTGVTLTGEWHR